VDGRNAPPKRWLNAYRKWVNHLSTGAGLLPTVFTVH